MSDYVDEQYVSKMPKMMIIILLERLLGLIGNLHTASLDKKLSKEELTEQLTEIFHKSDNILHMLVAKHLCKDIANWPDEIDLLEQEMEHFKLFWANDLGDAGNVVANAEMDIFLNSIGIVRKKSKGKD